MKVEAGQIRIRVREPAGQFTAQLPGTATLDDLFSVIAKRTSFSDFDIKHGYPPKPLLLREQAPTIKLSEMDIKLDGETLVVSRSNTGRTKPPPAPEPAKIYPQHPSATEAPPGSNLGRKDAPIPSTFSFAGVGTAPPPPPTELQKPVSLNRKANTLESDAPELPLLTHAATLLLRIMPDDNSCLFRAFNTAYFGAMDNMTELRSIIAQNIQANPDTYDAAILDQEPDDYCRWIQTEQAWGGAIELGILSKHFDIEICSIDVQTLRTDRFNEGKPHRCILVYSGIHYDTIATSPSDYPHTHAYAPPEFDTKVFDAQDSVVLEGAVELCRILQGKHYFTDTAKFTIKCNVCGAMAMGEKGAVEHEQKTGHWDFGEAERLEESEFSRI